MCDRAEIQFFPKDPVSVRWAHFQQSRCWTGVNNSSELRWVQNRILRAYRAAFYKSNNVPHGANNWEQISFQSSLHLWRDTPDVRDTARFLFVVHFAVGRCLDLSARPASVTRFGSLQSNVWKLTRNKPFFNWTVIFCSYVQTCRHCERRLSRWWNTANIYLQLVCWSANTEIFAQNLNVSNEMTITMQE